MNRTVLASLLLLLGFAALHGQQTNAPIDFNKARQFFEHRQRGETLTSDERAYLERAIAERRKQQGSPANQRPAPERLTPLTDMSASDGYEGEDGGLYGGGRNSPPEGHRRAAETELGKIRPLNAEGQPDDEGVIGVVAISMSNATQEFSRFKQLADRSPLKSPKVVIVDCAQGGQAMAEWAPADGRPWDEARRRLAAAKLSLRQVQAAWIKLANKGPTGSLQEHGRRLEHDTLAVLQNAKAQFPNLRIVYLGSRIYGGYAVGGLNPEPYAYESAFVARWLIQRQIRGDAELALTKSPLLLWGPYLWAEGSKGRQVDSLVWKRTDFGADGVHPSDSGRQKVAELLLKFFTTDPLAKPWFTVAPAAAAAAAVVESAKAFPTAEGFGAYAVGGRGGRVVEVTNLNDGGPGSLRAAMEASGPRICVFRVSGTITLTSAIRVSTPYLTVAGQTSPGGVQIGMGARISSTKRSTTPESLFPPLRSAWMRCPACWTKCCSVSGRANLRAMPSMSASFEAFARSLAPAASAPPARGLTWGTGAPAPPPDSDHDGMSDPWEVAHGLDPRDASDGTATAANGYSNVENYLNELAGDPIPRP